MSWKDRLRPASFRGARFHVEGASTEGGRRTARHQFINRDIPYHEDLGRRGREFRVTAWIVPQQPGGADYFDLRDALWTACEQTGPGLLVHPYYGQRLVTCRGITVREDRETGRTAALELTFEEAGQAPKPEAGADHVGLAAGLAEELATTSGEQLVADVRVAGVPEYVRTAGSAELARVGELLGELRIFSSKAQQVAAFQVRVQRLVAESVALLLAPTELVVAVRQALAGILDAAENGLAAFYAYRVLFGLEPSTAAGGASPTQRLAGANSRAVLDHVRQVAAAQAVIAATAYSWETREQALAVRAELAAELLALAETAPDELYRPLLALRTAAIRALPPPGQELPRLGRWTPPGSTSSLVAAYALHDDPRRALQIVERNRPVHPGFLPGGEPLEIVTP